MLRFRSISFLVLPLLFTPILACGQAGDPGQAQDAPSASSSKPSNDQPATPEAPAIPPDAPHMFRQTRFEIIRDFETQMVYARTAFPMGTKGLQLKEGVITPNGEEMRQALAIWGPAVKPGDPAHISLVQIKDDHIHFEINGGPIRHKKWYQRLEISGAQGTGVTPGAGDNPEANAHGTFVDVYFGKYVPEMTPQQLRALLYPVLDFNARNKEEAYLDTVPPKVKEAIKAHHVLVGMNQDMVVHAKGRPPKKVRERDGETEYEEWIYGEPPADVDFVRIVGDEVVRVETMKMAGEKIVRTEKEVVLQQPERQAKKESGERPANAPSLRRPGEDTLDVPNPSGPRPMPAPPPPTPDSPQPGSGAPPPMGPPPGSGPGEIVAGR
jgi:hypothetical protein